MIKPRRHSRRNSSPDNESAAPRRTIWQSGYWLVLALLATSYVLCASQTSPKTSLLALMFQLVTVAVTLWVAEVGVRLRRLGLMLLVLVASIVVAVEIAALQNTIPAVVLASASMVAYLVAPVAIIAHQLRKVVVDGQTLLASIAAYVMVGMFFTFVFNLIALLTPTPLFGPGTIDSLTGQLFFSFTTLTTTGYGNLVPVGALVQSVAIAEAITGQLFLVIAIARIVSGWQPRR
ncbi:ion channel [Mycetocola zhadangensis]|uniref:Two pore domain potassium channel family protein n=1 Tax=Mycetocola zhadangensis TaxID=1164595 RepID=A0A3L7J745_9MICO|nr:ion channel [Mycetocola zhadangensis]RLQ86370.1 two pore domain potassium channel family protein [Mycetocola zhadangensis]GGE90620.1 hypothetical protein GCM10011313_11880 [Mycetocola zhadangensis]